MADGNSFEELIRRVRAGDGEAAAEIVRRYEPAIRLAVRARLTDPNLRRLFDSMDVCQSVLGSFFVRAAAGQYQIDQPAQLLHLLQKMALNKLVKQAEHHRAGRRDVRRTRPADADGTVFVDPGPGPGSTASLRDLLRAFFDRLTPEERGLIEQRAEGRGWAEIAAATGCSPDQARMRATRAIDRVSRVMDL